MFAFDAYDWRPYGNTPGTAPQYFTNSQLDNDRSNLLNYAPFWYYGPNIGVFHNLRSQIAFFDGRVELLQPTSPFSYGATNDLHWKF